MARTDSEVGPTGTDLVQVADVGGLVKGTDSSKQLTRRFLERRRARRDRDE